jgi:hypothetical protein
MTRGFPSIRGDQDRLLIELGRPAHRTVPITSSWKLPSPDRTLGASGIC